MTETFHLQGRWWLSDHEDHQVFGTLSWDPEEGGVLRLHDELRPVESLDRVRVDGSGQQYRANRGGPQQTYPLIFGRVGNREYTLLDSFRLSVEEYDLEERTEKVLVNRFLEGAWFDDPDELCVDRAAFEMRHLTAWIGRSGLKVDWSSPGGTENDVFAVVTAKSLPSLIVEQDDREFRLMQRLGTTGDEMHDAGVTQSWSFALRAAEPKPLDTFIATASDFQDLVSVATGKTAQLEKVVLAHPDVPLKSLGGSIGGLRGDITYYVRWSNQAPPCEPVKRPEAYFTFDDFGGIGGVGRWLTVAAEYRTELGRVMATRYRESMFIEDRIMNVSAALDSFDKHRRATGKSVKYARRLKECVSLAGEPFLDLIVCDPVEWIEQVVATRHDLAHHRERFRDSGTVGNGLLADQLYWLFALCMLRMCEAPAAAYDRISQHRQIRWLTEEAERYGGRPA